MSDLPNQAAESSGKHWSKDFVEHLRSVHFTLLAVSIGVVILALAHTQSEISRAHEQVKQIQDLSKMWDADLLLTSAQSSTAPDAPFANGPMTISVKGPSETLTVTVTSLPNVFVELGRDKANPKGSLLPSRLPAKIDSLKSFQEAWDALQSGADLITATDLPIHCVLVPFAVTGNTWRMFNKEAKALPCEISRKASNVSQHSAYAERISQDDERAYTDLGIPDFQYADMILVTGSSEKEYIILVALDHIKKAQLKAELALIGKYPQWKWHTGIYKDSFRELASISAEYASIDLVTAEKIVGAEEKRTTDALDAFGMKFPAETAIRWGLGSAIILIVQLYLWVHLFEFRRKLGPSDEGWDVAWMGVYETSPSRAMLYFSLLFFPLVGVFAVGIRAVNVTQSRWYWLLLIATSIASLTLSLLICNALPKRKELIADEQVRADEKTKAATLDI